MILVAITVGGAVVLTAAGFVDLIAGQFHPAHRARLVIGLLLTGVFALEAGLVLWSLPMVLDLFGFVDLAAMCRRILGGPTPGGVAGGLTATAGAVWVGGAMVKGWGRVVWTQRNLRVESAISGVQRRDGFDLHTLTSPRRMAYTVGGRRPQIVVTTGLLEQLSPAVIEVILAHERVHARSSHHRFLAVAGGVQAAFGWVAPVRRAVDSLRLSLERWADEGASQSSLHGRGEVKHALLSVCLAGAPGAAGFGEPEMVSARVSALDGPAPSRFCPRLATVYLGFGGVTLSCLVVVGWAAQMSILTLVHPGQCLV